VLSHPNGEAVVLIGDALYRSAMTTTSSVARAVLDLTPALDSLFARWERVDLVSVPQPVQGADTPEVAAPEERRPAWWASGTNLGWLASLALGLTLVALQGRKWWAWDRSPRRLKPVRDEDSRC
jgi:hypothetical protein